VEVEVEVEVEMEIEMEIEIAHCGSDSDVVFPCLPSTGNRSLPCNSYARPF